MAYATPAWALSRSPVNVLAPVSDVFDGITVAVGKRVLLTGQTTHSENGVWLFAGTRKPMSRPGAGDQYASGNVLDNATLIPVSHGTTYAGTVCGIDPAAVVTVDTDLHTLTRVVLPPVQCRAATAGNVDLVDHDPRRRQRHRRRRRDEQRDVHDDAHVCHVVAVHPRRRRQADRRRGRWRRHGPHHDDRAVCQPFDGDSVERVQHHNRRRCS